MKRQLEALLIWLCILSQGKGLKNIPGECRKDAAYPCALRKHTQSDSVHVYPADYQIHEHHGQKS